jgi:hypothetical protein
MWLLFGIWSIQDLQASQWRENSRYKIRKIQHYLWLRKIFSVIDIFVWKNSLDDSVNYTESFDNDILAHISCVLFMLPEMDDLLRGVFTSTVDSHLMFPKQNICIWNWFPNIPIR